MCVAKLKGENFERVWATNWDSLYDGLGVST